MTPLESRCITVLGKCSVKTTSECLALTLFLIVRKEVMLSRTNLDWLHSSSSAFLSQEISHLGRNSLSPLRSLHAPQWHCKKEHLREKTSATAWRQFCVNVSSFPFLAHGYGNLGFCSSRILHGFSVRVGVCFQCYSGDIEICNMGYTGESILTLLTYICSDVGLMFSHDGRTERWGTDGSKCLINLEVLNISVHKVEETKHAVCSGSEMPAAVRVENPTRFTLHLSMGGGGASAKQSALHSPWNWNNTCQALQE